MLFDRVYGTRRARSGFEASTWLSLGIHAAALGVVASTTGVAELMTEQVHRGIYFFAPPPTTSAGPSGTTETITYLDIPGGLGEAAAAGSDVGAPPTPVEGTGAVEGGEAAGQLASASQELTSIFDVQADSIYLSFQVDNPVAYDARSLAPAYPDSLRQAGVEGAVTAQFVVDTTGRVDVTSFVLLESTHGRFTQAVREALPGMLFHPAELNGRRIRQLVQLPFLFKIDPSHGTGVADTTRVAMEGVKPPA